MVARSSSVTGKRNARFEILGSEDPTSGSEHNHTLLGHSDEADGFWDGNSKRLLLGQGSLRLSLRSVALGLDGADSAVGGGCPHRAEWGNASESTAWATSSGSP